MHIYKILPFFLLLLLFLFRSFYHLNFPMFAVYDGMGDAHVRVMEVALHYYPSYGTWMPLMHYFIKLSLFAYNNIFIAPRIAIIIINFILITLVFLITNLLYKKRIISLLAIALFIFNPFIGTFTTIPISEPLFLVFLLLGLYFLFKEPKKIFFSAFFFCIANAIRYEGWYLYPLIICYLVASTSKKRIIIFSLIYFLVPFYWIVQNFFQTGNPQYFLDEKVILARKNTSYIWNNFWPPTYIWITKFVKHFGVLNILFVILNLKFRSRDKNSYFLLALSLFLICALIIQVYLGTMEWYPDQYLYVAIVLLIPLVAKGIFILLNWLSRYAHKRLMLVTLISVSLTYANNFIIGDYSQKIEGITIPSISSVISKYSDRNFLFTFSELTYPMDRDYIMYFAKHTNYSIEKERSDFPDQFLSFIYINTLFISDKDRLDTVKKRCDGCSVLYTGEKYIIWSQ